MYDLHPKTAEILPNNSIQITIIITLIKYYVCINYFFYSKNHSCNCGMCCDALFSSYPCINHLRKIDAKL